MEKKKILIVDDEESFTRMVKLNLEGTGKYEVRTENKGAAALNAAKAFKPDIILLDIVMPDIAGSDVVIKLQEDEAIKNIPVVFLTALVTKKETGESCNFVGGHNFIAKPVNLKGLIECIEKHTKKT